MGGVCGAFGGKEGCIQGFGSKTLGKDAALKT
jgi:hypothetical protein